MSEAISRDQLAVNGGPKAVTRLTGGPPKFGLEELREVIDLWPLSAETRARIDAALDEEHLAAGRCAEAGGCENDLDLMKDLLDTHIDRIYKLGDALRATDAFGRRMNG